MLLYQTGNQHSAGFQQQNSDSLDQAVMQHQQTPQHFYASQQSKSSEFDQEMEQDLKTLQEKGTVKREGGLRQPTGTACPDFAFNLQGLYPAELREDGVRFSVMYQVRHSSVILLLAKALLMSAPLPQ